MTQNRKHIKFPHSVLVKAPWLLPMRYKVSELAKEIKIPERTLRDWLANGAPHYRDETRHIWIHGVEFSEWIAENKKKKPDRKLGNDEAFCMRCKEAVKLINPEIIPGKGKLIYIRGKCPQCGCAINRGGRNVS